MEKDKCRSWRKSVGGSKMKLKEGLWKVYRQKLVREQLRNAPPVLYWSCFTHWKLGRYVTRSSSPSILKLDVILQSTCDTPSGPLERRHRKVVLRSLDMEIDIPNIYSNHYPNC
jgi:hypothetical protein